MMLTEPEDAKWMLQRAGEGRDRRSTGFMEVSCRKPDLELDWLEEAGSMGTSLLVSEHVVSMVTWNVNE